MLILMTIGTPDFTGAPRMAFDIARALVAAGHRLIVVTGRRPVDGRASVIDKLRGIGIEAVEEDGFDRQIPDRGLIRRISELVVRERVQLLLSEVQLDVKIMVFVAQKTKVPLVYHALNHVMFHNRSFMVRALKKYLYGRLLRKRVAKVICCSESVRIQHIREFRIPESRAVTIDNGIDLSRFKPIDQAERDRIRSDFGISNDQLMLLNVGRITHQKGQDLLLRSLIQADLAGRDYRLVLIGARAPDSDEDAEYEQKLHRLADAPELKGKCIFAGWRNDVPSVLHSADAYFHSANWEGLPLAVLEAMAAGLPTVWTDCAGTLSGFAPGVHGYIARTGDQPGFTSLIEELLSLTESQRREMGRAAVELVRTTFDVEILGRRFVEQVQQAATPIGAM
ncbi:MAG: glycosyltransferase family 1 protein [Schlesneria sp.]|nr:glycosyltransferase family 1 protein [Schlesneria sp.]